MRFGNLHGLRSVERCPVFPGPGRVTPDRDGERKFVIAGYRVARRIRVGFNVDRVHRASPVVLQAYNGLRFGMSVTYGF